MVSKTYGTVKAGVPPARLLETSLKKKSYPSTFVLEAGKLSARIPSLFPSTFTGETN